MQSILRIPNVIAVENDQLSDEEWEVLQTIIKDAIKKLNDSRKMEGEILAQDMRARIHEINSLLEKVHPLEKLRLEKIKSNLQKDLQHLQ